MNTIDAMKQALYQLECIDYSDFARHDQQCLEKAIPNLEIAIAELESAEPVAIVDDAGVIIVCSYTYKAGDELYLHPAQSRDSIIEECAAVCDALRQEWARLKVGAYDGRYDMMEEAATVCEDSIRALKGE